DGGLHVPLAGNGEELLQLLRGDHGHHPLLRFAHQDLAGGQSGVAQQHVLQIHVHTALTVGGQFTGGTGDAGGAQVLDCLHHAGGEQLQAAFDEDLLHERVTDLHAGPFGGLVRVEGLTGEDGGAADAVAAGDRKSTRLNSSHVSISYAVFCLE